MLGQGEVRTPCNSKGICDKMFGTCRFLALIPDLISTEKQWQTVVIVVAFVAASCKHL